MQSFRKWDIKIIPNKKSVQRNMEEFNIYNEKDKIEEKSEWIIKKQALI